MPFYGADCVGFPFLFPGLRPGFRAIWLTHRRVAAKRAADGHPVRGSVHCLDRQHDTAGVFRQLISS